MSNFHTSQEVAEILNVSTVCLCLWRQDGIGPPWHKRDHRILYPANTFAEYIAKVGPIPAGMTSREKGQFFKRAHDGATIKPHRVRAAEFAAKARKARKAKGKTGKPRKIRLRASEAPPEPAIDPETFTELSARVFNLERVILRMVADQTEPKLKPRRVKRRAAGAAGVARRVVKRRTVRKARRVAPKVPTPTPDDVFPY